MAHLTGMALHPDPVPQHPVPSLPCTPPPPQLHPWGLTRAGPGNRQVSLQEPLWEEEQGGEFLDAPIRRHACHLGSAGPTPVQRDPMGQGSLGL